MASVNNPLNNIVQIKDDNNCNCGKEICLCTKCNEIIQKKYTYSERPKDMSIDDFDTLMKQSMYIYPGHMCLWCAIDTVFMCTDCGTNLNIWQAEYVYANEGFYDSYYEEDSIDTDSQISYMGQIEARCRGVCRGPNCNRCNLKFNECKCIIWFTIHNEEYWIGDSNPHDHKHIDKTIIVQRKCGQSHEKKIYGSEFVSGNPILETKDLLNLYDLKNSGYSMAGALYGDMHIYPKIWKNHPIQNLLDP